MSESYQRKMHADLDDKQLKNISLGDKVRIVTYGKVCELRDSDEYEVMPCGCSDVKTKGKKSSKSRKIPASITIVVAETKVEEADDYSELEDGDE